MRPRPALAVTTLVGLVLLLLAGCTGPRPLDPDTDGRPTAPPLTGLVFVVYPGAGFAPLLGIVRTAPSLLVYGDGTILRNTAPWGSTAVYETTHADPAIVAGFVAEVVRDPLFTGKRSLGDPAVTDQGVTVVRAQGAEQTREVSVYAFAESFDRYVSWSQQRNRAALRELIVEAAGLAGDEPFRPYVPDVVAVVELTPPERHDLPAPRWPGPDPATLLTGSNRLGKACGLVHGADAAALAAAVVANRDGLWTLSDGTLVQLAVNADPEAATWCTQT